MKIPPWLQMIISVSVSGFVLWHVPAVELWNAVGKVEPIWFLPTLASTLAMLFTRYQKWRRLLAAAGLPVSRADATRSLLCGFALSVVTPGRLGEFGRCLFLPPAIRGLAFQLNLLERALDAWSVFTYAVVSLSLIMFRPVGVFSLAVWLALLPVFMGLPGLVSSVAKLKFWRGRFRAQLLDGVQSLQGIRSTPFAGWALASTWLDLMIFFFLLQAFHRTDFTVALVTFPWIVAAAGLPVSVGGIGPREGMAAFLLVRYAVPAAAAMDAALLLFAFSALLPAVIGGVWILVRHVRYGPPRAIPCEGVAPGA